MNACTRTLLPVNGEGRSNVHQEPADSRRASSSIGSCCGATCKPSFSAVSCSSIRTPGSRLTGTWKASGQAGSVPPRRNQAATSICRPRHLKLLCKLLNCVPRRSPRCQHRLNIEQFCDETAEVKLTQRQLFIRPSGRCGNFWLGALTGGYRPALRLSLSRKLSPLMLIIN